MTPTSSPTSSSWVSPHRRSQPLGRENRSYRRWACGDGLVSGDLSPQKKPFLVNGPCLLFFSLLAPSAFGGRFACTPFPEEHTCVGGTRMCVCSCVCGGAGARACALPGTCFPQGGRWPLHPPPPSLFRSLCIRMSQEPRLWNRDCFRGLACITELQGPSVTLLLVHLGQASSSKASPSRGTPR